MAPQNRPQPTNAFHFHRSAMAPGGDGGHGVHEGDHVEEEADDGRPAGADDRVARQREAALPQEHPAAAADQRVAEGLRVAEVVAGQHVAVAAEHEGVADQEEPDEAEPEDGEVRRDHVGGVLGTAEPGLDQREPGLHEDDEHGADDDPQQVGLLAERGHRLGRVDVLGTGRPGRGQDQAAAMASPIPTFRPGDGPAPPRR